MSAPPAWLLPWLVPLTLFVGIIATAVSVWFGIVMFCVLFFGGLPYLRVQYLKQHPPEPELRRRNFWDFR